MLVDSSVWVDFLHARETPQTDYLKSALHGRIVFAADLVAAEVLQGTRDERTFRIASGVFDLLPWIVVSDRRIAVAAARNNQVLRAKGITVRKTVDTLIAARCIHDDIPLLYRDRDFDHFVRHLGLVSALPASHGNS
jgi:predicted nucleic acid-binding protein